MGVVVLDSSVLIGVLDVGDAHHAASVAALRELREQRHSLVVPAVAYAEVLVGAVKARGAEGRATVDGLLTALPAAVAVLDAATAAAGAELRARHRALRLPDALVIATAVRHSAIQVLTADHGWPRRLEIPVKLLA